MTLALVLLASPFARASEPFEETWTSSHTYFYDTVAPGDFPADVVDGAITWTYDGQQHFHHPGSPGCEELDAALGAGDWLDVAGVHREEVRADVSLAGPASYEDQIWAQVRVDDLGRRWVVADVDFSALQDKVDGYARMISEKHDTDWPSWDVESDLSREYSFTDDEEGRDYTWYDNDCDGIFNTTGMVTYWEDDTRDRMETADWTTGSEAMLASVLIYTNRGTSTNPSWGPSCSGAYVDGNDILTAAHCIWDNAADVVNAPSKHRVCTQGNYGEGAVCFSVGSITPNPSYATAENFSTDYALMRLNGSSSPDFYALSNHTTSELQALSIRHWGSPGWEDADQDPCVTGFRAAKKKIDNLHEVSALFTIFDSGESSEVTSTVIGAQIDAGEGQSGGPFYVWEGSVPTHVGLLKGWHHFPAYNGGPRTSAYRSWIISNICTSC